jgi:ATP-dependent RNA helicase DHX33
VIDAGKVKAKSFNPASGLDLLKIQAISQAQAWQRSGHAGREDSGTCYRLYSEEDFRQMPVASVPEILRCNLGSVMLQVGAMVRRRVDG